MTLTLIKKYYWLNSNGDMKSILFDTSTDAETWLTSNGIAGHDYVLITEYQVS